MEGSGEDHSLPRGTGCSAGLSATETEEEDVYPTLTLRPVLFWGLRTFPQAKTLMKGTSGRQWGTVGSEALWSTHVQEDSWEGVGSCQMGHGSQKYDFYCEIAQFIFLKSVIGKYVRKRITQYSGNQPSQNTGGEVSTGHHPCTSVPVVSGLFN